MPASIPLPPLSSIEVIVALHRGGFELTTETSERVVLTRGERTIVVERHRTLLPQELLLLLRSARVTPEQFLDMLAPLSAEASGTRRRTVNEVDDSRDPAVRDATRARHRAG
jgi:hypothetical protein